MGKKPSENTKHTDFTKNDLNLPLNPSLSYTLNHFVTYVEIEESKKDQWQAFKQNPFQYADHFVFREDQGQKQLFYYSKKDPKLDHSLSEENQKKFIDFFQYLKKVFFISGNYTLRSVTNFPLSAGVASSASSFASLCLAAYELAKDQSSKKDFINSLTRQDLSTLARLGSGSACRSLFSPWAVWQNQHALNYQCPFDFLIHQLVIIDDTPKKISSRQAHKEILSSPNFKGRLQRVEKHLKDLMQSLQTQNWKDCFKICMKEFEDMHNLFETSQKPFSYRNDLSKQTLKKITDFWENKKDGPIVTMDAGANIHLLYRPDQKELALEVESLFSDLKIFSSDIER